MMFYPSNKFRLVFSPRFFPNNADSSSLGFNLIELLIVVAIISILTIFFFNIFRESSRNGRDVRRKGDFTQIKVSLETYFDLNRTYPDSASGKIKCPSGPTLNWGAAF